MSTLAERIKEAMEGASLRPADLARATKKTSGAVTMWLGGGIKSLKAESAAALEAVTGYSAEWIVTGKLPKKRPQTGITEAAFNRVMWDIVDEGNTAEDDLHNSKVRVPVVATVQMGEEGLYEELAYPLGRPDGYIEGYSRDPNAYALRIRGDGLHPAIRDGQYVVVEPTAACEPGEYVVIALDEGHRMIKEFMFERGGIVTVLSVNTGKRSTFDRAGIPVMHPIVAVVSARRWHPN
ncbi:S24 family peptidase [Rhizobacter sp. SG703]|uniref:S24 family peptidase n=1 Tax=Rhizobacter sp. SG703 TaxID=2587140 RepID=UPI001446AAB4|nr:S24 family peptidase [Rhizobacter sp. SG703]NKI94736.1 phage repressor protein C with HTH and peptisase S24 domain [Rhizobacter sp. SG703]